MPNVSQTGRSPTGGRVPIGRVGCGKMLLGRDDSAAPTVAAFTSTHAPASDCGQASAPLRRQFVLPRPRGVSRDARRKRNHRTAQSCPKSTSRSRDRRSVCAGYAARPPVLADKGKGFAQPQTRGSPPKDHAAMATTSAPHFCPRDNGFERYFPHRIPRVRPPTHLARHQNRRFRGTARDESRRCADDMPLWPNILPLHSPWATTAKPAANTFRHKRRRRSPGRPTAPSN